MQETITDDPILQTTVEQGMIQNTLDNRGRTWHDFAETYRDELPDALHPHVERLLEAHGVTAPSPGEAKITDQAIERIEESPTVRWRRLYGNGVTAEQARLFTEIENIFKRPVSKEGDEGASSIVFAEGRWRGSDRLDRWEETRMLTTQLPKDSATAEFIIDQGYAPYIAGSLAWYEALNLAVARKLIEEDFLSVVFDKADKFPPLDRSVARTLIENNAAIALLNNLDKFPGIKADNALALELVAQDHGRVEDDEKVGMPNHKVLQRDISRRSHEGAKVLIAHLGKFENLDGKVLHELIKAIDAEVELTNIVTPDAAEKVVNQLHKFTDLRADDLDALRQYTCKQWLQECPSEVVDPRTGEKRPVSENAINRWFGEMSYTYLKGGFSKASIGKVIRTRVETKVMQNGVATPIETSIHDASQWLSEFAIKETAYDAQAILRAREQPGFDPSEIYETRLFDEDTEHEFFPELLYADPALRARLNLGSKAGTAEHLFESPSLQLAYKAATSDYEGHPLYKHPDFSVDMLEKVMFAMLDSEFEANGFGHAKEETSHQYPYDQFVGLTKTVLRGFRADKDRVAGKSISETLRELKAMGAARKNYVQDTQRWLLQNATSPSSRLTKAWKARGLALAQGIADNPTAIEQWQNENGMRIMLRQAEATGELQEMYGFTADEVMSEENRYTRETLLGALSAENTLRAMAKIRDWSAERGEEPKVLPPDAVEAAVDVDGKKSAYKLEILPDGDPRGFTIGVETGCCMTIDGESKSCIEAGYALPHAGFLAVYPPGATKAGAQSFWYVHPDYPDTLVLDNIEANAGRDMAKMADVYRQGLAAYLAAHKETGITKVHVGTGYTHIDLGNAPRVDAVPRLKRVDYTDARKQLLLLDTDKE